MSGQETLPAAVRKTIRFDTLNVRVYDEAKRVSPTLSRGQARDVLAAVLRHLYRASDGELATAEVTLAQGMLAYELQLSRQWLGVVGYARPPHRVIYEPGGIWLCSLKESNYQIGTLPGR